MHRPVTSLRRAGERDQRGIAAIAVALSTTALLVVAAMVFDLGLVRVDRQVDKSAADSAVTAGLSGLISSGDGKPHPYIGVCSALRYLRTSDFRFSGITSASGTWTNGSGGAAANGCTDTTAQSQTCVPGSLGSWARFVWQDSVVSPRLRVQIQSGYQAGPTSGWREDTLPAAQADPGDGAQGCDQLSVIITQRRKPGVGSIARSSDLVSSIRSVGRVVAGPGGYAPAMLLLKRTGCTSLEVGSTAGDSWVKVKGAVSSNGVSQPGTIHADADGLSCSTSVYYGKAAGGIVAYAAPLVSSPLTADPKKPGQITSVAQAAGRQSYDAATKVYSTTGLDDTSGTHITPTGRGLVTRQPVDNRYLSGVRAAISGANSTVFAVLTAGNAAAAGYTVASCSSGNIASLPVLTASDKLFINCGNLKAMPPTDAGTVVFNGTVSPSGTLSLPKAHHVYIFGPGDAISLGHGNTFSMHTSGNLTGSTCTDSPRPVNDKAVLFVKSGDIKETDGALQMCNTTVFMMGGQTDGCTPTPGYAAAPPPSQTPCGGTMGTGQIFQSGGAVDWTAPNEQDVMTLTTGEADPAKAYLWSDTNGPEDLALWDESAGNSSSAKYQFTGVGGIHLQGIFMVPNADPISLSGNANFVLKNAQFVATSLALASNNTTLQMTVDPNSAVQLPKLQSIGLVR